MTAAVNTTSHWIARLGQALLPFADAVSERLPLSRLLRLALFQMSVGMSMVLLTGTLNRVMIVELGVPAWLVATMVSLPLVVAPFRALIGFRSDSHRSALGWRRAPFIWFGTLMQFGGLAIMPFALLLLSGDTVAPPWVGQSGAALAFLLVGAGIHTTQTAGLALATDLSAEEQRPQVVALLFVMLLLGMLVSALLFGLLLRDFSQFRLIQVIQGAAVVALVLNTVALVRQEARERRYTVAPQTPPKFSEAWHSLLGQPRAVRVLAALAFGTLGFTMQDILLEPFGAEVLGLSVSATTALTAIHAFGMLSAFALASWVLRNGTDAHRLAAYGALLGVLAFALITIVALLVSPTLFRVGVLLIGFGTGLFAVGTLSAAMELVRDGASGIAIGAWGAVQATATGVAVAAGGAIADTVASLAERGALGATLTSPATGYSVVYQIEVLLLFVTLVVIGPLARHSVEPASPDEKFGLAEIPN